MTPRSIHDCVTIVREAELLDRSPARVRAMQRLIDDGIVWMLDKHLGITAEWMIDEGLCRPSPCGRISRCGRRRSPLGG